MRQLAAKTGMRHVVAMAGRPGLWWTGSQINFGRAGGGRQAAPMIWQDWPVVRLGFGRRVSNHKNGRAGTQHMADRVGSGRWAAIFIWQDWPVPCVWEG